jgi:hypothetical protein
MQRFTATVAVLFFVFAQAVATTAQKSQPASQRPTVFYFEFYEQGGRQSVRFNNWKAIREPMFTGAVQLYDLSKDIGETNDIANAAASRIPAAATGEGQLGESDQLRHHRCADHG